MTRPQLAAVALGLFGFGALAGRMTVPAKVVSVDRLVEVQREAKAQVAAAQAAKVTHAKADVRWLTKTVYEPGGTITVTKTVVKEVERSASESTFAASSSTETHEAVRAEVHERIVETARPQWSVAARAGLALDGKFRYQGDVGRRLVGGLWLTVGADVTSRAALLGLRMEF